MDVRCERCQTEYELEESSVSEGGTPVQCTACGHTFLVTPGSLIPPPEPQTSSPAAADLLLETSDGTTHRFRSLTSLQKWIIERKVTREDRISRTGHAWRGLGEIVELAPFFDVVDEADRARAAAITARSRDEAAGGDEGPTPGPGSIRAAQGHDTEPSVPVNALRSTQAPAPAPLPEQGGQSDWPEPNTSVTRLPTGAVLKVLLALGVAAAVAYVGIAQLWQRSWRLPRISETDKSAETDEQPGPSPAANPVGVAPGAVAAGPGDPTAAPAPGASAPDAGGAAAAAAASGAASAEITRPPAVTADPATGGAPGPVATPAAPAAPSPAAAPAAAETPPEGERPMSYGKLVAEGDRALEDGARDKAQSLYERALKLRSSGPEALAGMGYLMLDRGRQSRAGIYFKRALARTPSFGPALFGLAEAHRAGGDEESALDEYRRYVAADPTGSDVVVARRQIKALEAHLAAKAAGGTPAHPVP